MWEQEGCGRVGVEAYVTGPQRLASGRRASSSPGSWPSAGPVRAFVTLENLLDARQSRTSPVVAGPPEATAFAEIWGPTDGVIANGGLAVEL